MAKKRKIGFLAVFMLWMLEVFGKWYYVSTILIEAFALSIDNEELAIQLHYILVLLTIVMAVLIIWDNIWGEEYD